MYSRGATVLEKTNLEGLYELIWIPLESAIGNINTIYYSPTGIMHRISFDAIPVKEDQRLSDYYQLIRLGSSRSLAQSVTKSSSIGKEVLLFGGINYDQKSDSLIEARSMSESKDFADTPEGDINRAEIFQANKWSYLKGTKKEVRDIADLLKANAFSVNIKTGSMATEESFNKLSIDGLSPRILHIATHGFFYPEPNINTSTNKFRNEEIAFKTSQHPLIRTGLLLAGANEVWSSDKSDCPPGEDGVLTAYEISQMDLTNTELVVLSACETGLGDILGNEGVYGLQRALKIAGAKKLIMSLWKVPDQETAKLMTSFYTYWLQEKLGIRESLSKAQKDFRDNGYDPYYWAGFILLE